MGPSGASGFSLIEIMVTIAVVGILVAISIPVYDRYQSMSRQTEAKIALGSVFESEKTFYAEYSSYISGFDALQYQPDSFRRFYNVGWNTAMTGTVTGFAGANTRPNYSNQGTFSAIDCPPAVGNPLLPAPVGSDAQTFLAGAAGEVRLGKGCDVWTIDNSKTMLNSVSKY